MLTRWCKYKLIRNQKLVLNCKNIKRFYKTPKKLNPTLNISFFTLKMSSFQKTKCVQYSLVRTPNVKNATQKIE